MKIVQRVVMTCLLAIPAVHAAEELSDEFLSAKPKVQLFMAYAEFKMGHHEMALHMWSNVKQAAEAEAAFNIGILYEQGLGVEKDIAEALRYYQQAAEGGSRAGAYQAGLIYLNHPDYGDRAAAEKWLSIAALDGDEDAAELLKTLNASDDDPVDDPIVQVKSLIAAGETEQAVTMLQDLVAQTPPDYRAMTRLAWLYEAGIGVERDIDQAGVLFKQAAEAGIAEAQYAIAVMYQTGVGQPQDKEQAHLWLKRSADQGFQPAVQKIGEEPR